jgi:hypothetical protein
LLRLSRLRLGELLVGAIVTQRVGPPPELFAEAGEVPVRIGEIRIEREGALVVRRRPRPRRVLSASARLKCRIGSSGVSGARS